MEQEGVGECVGVPLLEGLVEIFEDHVMQAIYACTVREESGEARDEQREYCNAQRQELGCAQPPAPFVRAIRVAPIVYGHFPTVNPALPDLGKIVKYVLVTENSECSKKFRARVPVRGPRFGSGGQAGGKGSRSRPFIFRWVRLAVVGFDSRVRITQ